MKVQPNQYFPHLKSVNNQSYKPSFGSYPNTAVADCFQSSRTGLSTQINVDNLKENVNFLCSESCAGRYPDTLGSKRAGGYIIEKFKQYGLKPFDILTGSQYYKSYTFQKTYKGVANMSSIEVEDWPMEITNVIGYIPAKSDEYIFITAHYDHLGRDMDTGKIYPGADDNASGVAALLEAARILSKQDLKKNVVFVATDGEEKGCLGARCLAKDLKLIGIKQKCKVINIDSVGTKGDFLTIQGEKWLDENNEMIRVSKKMAKDLHINVETDTKNGNTDALALAEAKIPAISYLWSYDEYETNRPYIHTTKDTPEEVDFNNIKKTAGVLINTVLKLAS